MPDRDKVIKGLTECVAAGLEKACPADCPYFLQCFPDVGLATPFVSLMADALALLKEQEEEPKANGWISVKDRLPEKEGQYLCWFGKNIMAKGAAIATYLEMWKSFGSIESLETYPNVTHWMPIESPEEVEWND